MDLPTIAAAVAGAVGARVAFHPLDTIRTLQQTSVAKGYVLPFHQYWRGLPAAVAFTTPAFTVYLVAYRQAKQELAPYLGFDSAANYVVSGTVAELLSSVLWTPMEIIKGRMQLQDGKAGTLATIARLRRTEGLRGLYRGYWMGLAVFTPYSIVWWWSYENVKRWRGRPADLAPTDYAVASAAAGTAAATVSNFLDVIKTRQQLAVADEVTRLRPDDRVGVWTVARNLVREKGVFRALFKGLHVRLMYSLPSGVLSMVIVETLKPEVDPTAAAAAAATPAALE
ncbi:mitochondrial carrier domain-containing protein [Dipodascopsis tothii]|uniref:mitochondrial carrier domain-containing protein n=1 Tax=Dipodascopsis tothii TaxID=44089 RepID=UPI0034CF4E77